MFSNRVQAIERGDDQADERVLARFKKWAARFKELEKEADEDIKLLTTEIPIIEKMIEVKGIGELLAAKVVSMIDIERADSVSALWRYAGYGVINGEREKPTKGEKLHYNARLKTTCYVVAGSFLKSNSPYRQIYDSAREYYAANRPDWSKGRQHNAAIRKMIKCWLAHLWLEWRKLEGLSTRPLYVNNHLGHEHYYAPQEFGWPTR